MGTFRVPSPTPSPPGSPERDWVEPTSSSSTSPPYQQEENGDCSKVEYCRSQQSFLDETICPATRVEHAGPMEQNRTTYRSLSRWDSCCQQHTSTIHSSGLSHHELLSQLSSGYRESSFDGETSLEPTYEYTQHAATSGPSTLAINVDETTHKSAPNNSHFSVPLIEKALYTAGLHRYRVVATLGPPGQWNHTNLNSHPLPPSGDPEDVYHYPNPFLHLPHTYAPAGQHFVRNVRENFSRTDRSVHPDLFNPDNDNPFVLPWFNNAENEAPRRPSVFGYLGSERSDMMETEEPLPFGPVVPPHELTFGSVQQAALQVPADGYGAMELDVPFSEGSSTVQAVWDGSTQTMKLRVGPNLGGM
ncbi:hypothetical protein FKW77_005915 [Venturia effusa]|uniref:Uncharacterized protein n=1 Tax=Venturia effusa TaxID=50376 RepID=A0A517L7F6_9PEZI|nr:hypothetical protein FKW77_005915 [Venturia effusa]